MYKFWGLAQDTNGNALQYATVTVYETGTSTKAIIYEDDGDIRKANPFQADIAGRYYFWYEGIVDIKIEHPDLQTPVLYTEVFCFDPRAHVHRWHQVEEYRTMYRRLRIDRSNSKYFDDDICLLLGSRNAENPIPIVGTLLESDDGEHGIKFVKYSESGNHENTILYADDYDVGKLGFKVSEYALYISFGMFYSGYSANGWLSTGIAAPVAVPYGTRLLKVLWAHQGAPAGGSGSTIFNIYSWVKQGYILPADVVIDYNQNPAWKAIEITDYLQGQVSSEWFDILAVDFLSVPSTKGQNHLWIGLYGIRPIWKNRSSE